MNPLIERMKTYGPISKEAEVELNKKTKCFRKKKHDFLLKQGQSVSSLFMIEEGLIRAFLTQNGKEVNTWFVAENVITGSILPLYANQISFENLQFLEDSLVYTLPNTDLNKLYTMFPELNVVGRKLAEEVCIILEKRITSLHINSAEERYVALLEEMPDITQRVSLGHIASYLGITQETLSRIRKR